MQAQQALNQQAQQAQAQAKAQAAQAHGGLHVGAEVTLNELKNATSLNGQTAIVESLLADTGRWRVKLKSGEVKDLKPENLWLSLKVQAPPHVPTPPAAGNATA